MTVDGWEKLYLLGLLRVLMLQTYTTCTIFSIRWEVFAGNARGD